MLIRDDGDTWTCIAQPAHAWVAGQLARAWAPALPDPVVLAIEQHDLAWAELDRRPPLHAPARRAASFYEVDLDRRLALWAHVADRVVMADPYAAVLVSMHATNIHTRYGRTHPEEFLAAQRTDQDALIARLPHASREQAERDADTCFRIDAISLQVCGSDADVVPIEDWPFAVEQLEVGAHERRIAERYDDESSLHAALDAAPFTWRSWTLVPAPAQ
jgi:hypothetical protein